MKTPRGGMMGTIITKRLLEAGFDPGVPVRKRINFKDRSLIFFQAEESDVGIVYKGGIYNNLEEATETNERLVRAQQDKVQVGYDS